MGLTKREIEAATYRGDGQSRDVRYEQKLAGFGIRIYPSGRKCFILRYRGEDRRDRLITLGPYPGLTLDQARRLARQRIADVSSGTDPLRERRRARAEATTVGEVADRWLVDYAKLHRRSWKEDKRRIETRIKPAIGSRTLIRLAPADIKKLHSDIGGTAPVEANRVVQLVRAIYNAAIVWGVLPPDHVNPAHISRSPHEGPGAGVRAFQEKSRERFVREDEMPRLLKAIEAEEDPDVRAVIYLILFTGCRKSEILGAKWSEVNLQRRQLILPEAKEGGRTVPLSQAAVDVLKTLAASRSPFVFPSPENSSRARSGIKRQWSRVRTAAKLEDVTLHDLRRTAGSWLAAAGTSDLIIGRVLGHKDPSATRIYARVTDDTAREHLDEFAVRVRRARLKVS